MTRKLFLKTIAYTSLFWGVIALNVYLWFPWQDADFEIAWKGLISINTITLLSTYFAEKSIS